MEGKDSPYVMLFKELLGEFVCRTNNGEKLGHIWAMKEYCVVASWTKLFTIELQEEVSKLSSFVHDKFLLSGDGKGFVLCEPENRQFRHNGNLDGRSNFEMITFVDSLVWLENQHI